MNRGETSSEIQPNNCRHLSFAEADSKCLPQNGIAAYLACGCVMKDARG